MSDDERRDDEQASAGEDEAKSSPPEEHQPATWAGRKAAGAGDEPDSARLTEDFDAVEREFSSELEEDLAAADEVPDDPLADEGEEPPDEFEFEEPVAEGADDAEAERAQAEAEEPDAAAEADGPDDGEPAQADADAPVQEEEPVAVVGQPTVEADTPLLAEREEAREAALAGLRARTAEHAAKRGVTDPGTPQPPPQATPPVPAATTAGADEDEGKRLPRLWPRFLAASFLIIASMAAATSVSALVYLTDIAKGLGGLEGLRGQLDAIEGEPQNFLVLGSDVRPDEPGRGRSDTTMLLRVDPDKNIISQLSIPRDLRVNIPGHGIDKFNVAYTVGGPKLALKVVKQLTDNRVAIHHVVNVDFNGFADAVDAIDCVYVDVDRHYFHSNEGLAFTEQYAEIDIQAGYQRLCGLKALQYVRYRHEDNDIVRAARQQTFLREARQKIPPSTLLEDRDELIDIFTEHTTSDIDDVATLVQLFKLMIDARGATINQISFPYRSLGDEQGYVTASADPLRQAVDEFTGEGIPTPAPDPSDGGDGDGGGGSGDGDKEPKDDPKPQPQPTQQTPAEAAASMIDSTGSGQQYAAAIDSPELKFPILYPTKLTPGSGISDDTRWFRIDGPGNQIFRGYKFVVTRPGSSYPTAYYGVSGTDWLDAPLFKNPTEERTLGDREYKLYFDSGRLRMVAFQRERAMYWVTNTLDKLLTAPQMIAIAQNLAEA